MATDAKPDPDSFADDEEYLSDKYSEDAKRGYLKEKARGTYNRLPKRDPDADIDDDLDEDD